jgi:hypothetical protein
VVPLLEDDQKTHSGKWKVKSEKCRKRGSSPAGGKIYNRTQSPLRYPITKDSPTAAPYDPTAVYTPIGSPYINATPGIIGGSSLSLDQTRGGKSFESARTTSTTATTASKVFKSYK